MRPQVLYVVMDRSVTSVRSTRSVAAPSRQLLPAAVLLRQRQNSEMVLFAPPFCCIAVLKRVFVCSFPGVEGERCFRLYVVTRMCLLLRTAGGQVVAIGTVLPGIGLFVSSTGNFNTSMLGHMKKLKHNAFVGAVTSSSLFQKLQNRGGTGPAHLQRRGRASVLQRQTQHSRQSGVVEVPQIQS